jgi:peptidoglycan/xylan/chitin deacetylase (PgdA/CDA1 family)
VLDILKKNGIRATFFLNSRNTLSLQVNADAKAALARVVSEGHVIGNHTAHHLLLSTRTPDEIESELSLLEQDVKAAYPCAPPITLVRAPFGSPYGSPTLVDEKAKVYPIVARHGVHVGWSIDPDDFDCTTQA